MKDRENPKRESRAPLRELVEPSLVSDLFRLEYSDVRFWYPWHFHAEVEIKQVVAGAGTRTVGTSIEPFEAGDLCLVGSGLPHCWQSKAVRGKWVNARVVQFKETIFESERATAFGDIRRLFSRARRGLVVTGRTRAVAETELEKLLEAQGEARKLGHLTTLLAIIAEGDEVRDLCSGAGSEPEDLDLDPFASHALAFMQESAGLGIAESEAAEHFGLSPSAFSRRFKREFAKTYSSYVAELRIARASNLLLRTGKSMTEIATLSGFGTVAGLNRHFRRIKGTTPTAYRGHARRLNAGFRSDEATIIRCGGMDAPDGRRARAHLTR